MRFRERVAVPPGWWALDGLFGLALGVAFGYYLGLAVGLGVGVSAFVAVALGFRTASFTTEVDDTELRVGRAVVGREWIASVRPLDAAGTRERSGVGADARAHLVLRPWISTTVEVTLADPADPVPYWLLSTRRPRALATALGWTPPAEAPGAPSSTPSTTPSSTPPARG